VKENSPVHVVEKKGDVVVWGPSGKTDTQAERLPRIICYGDSNTAGYFNKGKEFQPYGKSLASELAAAGTPCEVAVCGLCSFTTQDMLNERASTSVATPIGPSGRGLECMLKEDGPVDLVIIMTGTNDMGVQTSNSTIVQHVAQLHAICHDLGIPTVALAPTQVSSSSYRRIRERLAAMIVQWAGPTQGVLDALDVEDLLPRPVGKSGASKIPAAALYWERDDLHLSAAGSITLGQRLAKHVASWLKQIATHGPGLPPKAKSTTPISTPPASPNSNNRVVTQRKSSYCQMPIAAGNKPAVPVSAMPYSARSCGFSMNRCAPLSTASVAQLCR